MTDDALKKAEAFVWLSARLVDRARFAFHFLDGDAEAVVRAVQAYQNPDGGFGNALEPDFRAPESQPGATRSAFEMLDEVDGFRESLVLPACDFLQSAATAEGGVPFMLAPPRDYPRAPWWQPVENPPASVIFTAPIAGLLHKHRITHPWLERATDFCWRKLDAFNADDLAGQDWTVARIGRGYAAMALFIFLEHVPDRARAKEAFSRIGKIVLEQRLVELDPTVTAEVHRPLDYAPSPNRMTRRLFDDATVDAHLQAVMEKQEEDGGWMFSWKQWNPLTTLEWRGLLTAEKLKMLEAYGRLG